MTITPTLRLTMSLTMIALAIIMTSLSIASVLGAFTTVAAKLGINVVIGTLIGFNLALLCVSLTERLTLRRARQHAAAMQLH
ncbi:hypothetical protein [Rhodococcoides yunnanense]|uniref:hypothetical protein n=1 Tax=Rhodococcoides yunnanense TaxID=278209 RepID=UPI0022B0EEC3|nr:hypothetical protein [Rhodococcus yunnanensis]MCZ4277427.1 hypothetical protein [Rhodococcus yunnanensis]